MIETAGLKCEPEYGAKVQINTINPKNVAVLFASNIIALLSVRFSPIIPDPTTMRSKKKVPIVSEIIATFGLLNTILLVGKQKAELVAVAVGMYIGAAYWFTSSTSFSNPAVTIARTLSDTFTGISPSDVLPFIIAQFIGTLIVYLLYRFVYE